MAASELDAMFDDGSGVGAAAAHVRDDGSDRPSSSASKTKEAKAKAKVRASKAGTEYITSRFSNWGLVPDPWLN